MKHGYGVKLKSGILNLLDDKESQPWSNNSPNGEDVSVLRACLPSMASRVW